MASRRGFIAYGLTALAALVAGKAAAVPRETPGAGVVRAPTYGELQAKLGALREALRHEPVTVALCAEYPYRSFSFLEQYGGRQWELRVNAERSVGSILALLHRSRMRMRAEQQLKGAIA